MSGKALKTLGEDAWKNRADKVVSSCCVSRSLDPHAHTSSRHQNAELFTMTYGALVTQLIKDYEDYPAVNKQLDVM